MRPRVLILDDDPEFRNALGSLLDDEGLEAVYAPTGSVDPSVIVTELVKHNGSAAHVPTLVRDNEGWQHIPVLVFTGWGQSESPEDMAEPVAYKPDFQALLKMILRLTHHGGAAVVCRTSGST